VEKSLEKARQYFEQCESNLNNTPHLQDNIRKILQEVEGESVENKDNSTRKKKQHKKKKSTPVPTTSVVQHYNDECPICTEDFTFDVSILPCKHAMHKSCAMSYLIAHRKKHLDDGHKPLCPICRSEIPDNVVKSFIN
jgi:uncharacterized protein Veg